MAVQRFKASRKGIGELLVASFIRQNMRERAEAVRDMAVSISPTGDPATSDFYTRKPAQRSSSGPGEYARSFEVSDGTVFRAKGLRAYGRVTNTAPYASAVEYGFGGTIRYRILGRSLAAAGGDLRPELTY